MKHKILNRYTCAGLAIVVITVAAITMFAVKHHTAEAATVSKTPPAKVASQFTFTGATDWYQGPTRKSDMALFHKIKDSCFVSIQHITGTTIDAHRAKVHKFDGMLLGDGHVVTEIGIQNMRLKTDTGVKQYELRQTNVTSPAGATNDSGALLDGGVEEGYLLLSDKNFIYVEGDCETSSELQATLPALQSLTFNEKI